MNRVQLLSDEVIKKIAAGEVVERPASVVKELVENSLDAGARKIVLELEEGGTKRITIEDDGCGILADDCLLSLSRHATSKIRQDEDLFAIHTLGFRGEALAAISAVSDFTLSSRVRNSEWGTKVSIENGSPASSSQWNGNFGTTITVANLFCTVPVRAKFLKSAETEFAHCLDLIQALALASPHVSFSLYHNSKLRFSAPALDTDTSSSPWRGERILRERWELLVGKEEASQALYVQEENQYGRWEALLSAPGHDKATHKNVVHFVNGRWVKDKVLNFGLQRGYHSHLMKGRHPQVLSFLECDPTLIDVNVHPAKTELRFQYPAEVQGLMSYAIRKVMREAAWASLESPTSSSSSSELSSQEISRLPLRSASVSLEMTGSSLHSSPVSLEMTGSSLHSSPVSLEMTGSSHIPSRAHYAFAGNGSEEKADPQSKPTWEPTIQTREDHVYDVGDSFSSRADVPCEQIFSSKTNNLNFNELKYIGCFAKCYLLFESSVNSSNLNSKEKLLSVDQHAFHERILYERLCRNPKLLSQSQPLMIPEAIDLPYNGVEEHLNKYQNIISEAGFKIKFLENSTVEISAIPTLMVSRSYENFFVEFTKKLVEGSMETAQDIHHELLATIACHSAVRAGEELSSEQVSLLMKEAESVDFYHNCPHGRRVFKWFEKSQVASWFDR